MSSKIKPGLFFGILLATIFITEDLSSADVLTTSDIAKTIAVGIFGGAIAGFVFGFLIEKFRSSRFVNNSTKINIGEDEKILFQTPATHFKGAEGVGGKLYLTKKRLIFKSHKFNFQRHELSLSLDEITKVERYKILFIINNGLNVTTIQNTVERFVVEKAGEWDAYFRNLSITKGA